MRRRVPRLQRTDDGLVLIELFGHHRGPIPGIEWAMRQELRDGRQGNKAHAAIFRRHVLQWNPEDQRIVGRVLAMKRRILMPGRAMEPMRFFV